MYYLFTFKLKATLIFLVFSFLVVTYVFVCFFSQNLNFVWYTSHDMGDLFHIAIISSVKRYAMGICPPPHIRHLCLSFFFFFELRGGFWLSINVQSTNKDIWQSLHSSGLHPVDIERAYNRRPTETKLFFLHSHRNEMNVESN